MIVLRAWLSSRTWRELAFVLTGAVLSLPTFALAVLGLVASALSVVIFGLALLIGVLALARLTPRYFRAPARRLLGWDWPSPAPPTGTTRMRRVVGLLGDSTAWRALAYCFLRFPLIYTGAYGAVAGLFTGLVAVTYPVWWFVVPDEFWYGAATWPGTWWRALQGAAVLLVLPWVLRLVVLLDGVLVRALLRPTPAARRIAQLEAGRAALQEDAAALLRRVERDLHDGTQARLVSLGVALARIERRSTDEQVRALAGDARGTVTEALTELRDIVRGLHPPALDDGLEVALSTLAARSAVPATLAVDLPHRPPDATASALYFAVAELLTNIARHASATRASITVREEGPWLTLTVTDDGRGGAGRGQASGTGLSGLARRAAALDGSLHVESPAGGPTTITMKLPGEAG
ncbi:sensor histidine kinase [Nucisporomicrobium flavum]|uniref:sensor histidine kinase n=1 Tax=Nucisporomicrobium flavum TaxID=2785915 RepID=UPI0018F7BCEC|nr:sensor histidine kinase [Nucisporomicrobium flavum]